MTLFLIIAVPLLIAWAVARPTHSAAYKVPPAIMTGMGVSLGLVAYAVAFVVTMSVVPRKAEGIRNVVDLPWPVYVMLPATFAFLPLVILGLTVPKRNWSLFFIVGFIMTVTALTNSGSELLHRDYMGKF